MNKIKIAAIILVVLPFFSFNTLQHQPVYSFAKVNWEKEMYAFGFISQGKPVSVTFRFTNTGDEPLLVADVLTSCGCTATDYPKEPIAPGKSSQIKVAFNAASKGAFSKTITVKFDEATVEKKLTITGTVQ